ncbi:hypothetical protein STENM223S_06974 [Streptomyces tendae]
MHSLGSLGGGTATFGVLRNADYYLLADLVQMFHARYPRVRVRLVGQNSAETAAAVAAGRIRRGSSSCRSTTRDCRSHRCCATRCSTSAPPRSARACR